MTYIVGEKSRTQRGNDPSQSLASFPRAYRSSMWRPSVERIQPGEDRYRGRRPHSFSSTDAYGCSWTRAIASVAHADSAGMQTTCGSVSPNRGPRSRMGPAGGTVRDAARTVSIILEEDAKGPVTRCFLWMSVRITIRPVRSDDSSLSIPSKTGPHLMV